MGYWILAHVIVFLSADGVGIRVRGFYLRIQNKFGRHHIDRPIQNITVVWIAQIKSLPSSW